MDKVRAMCGLLGIGHAAELGADKPAALGAAVAALRLGHALRDTPFADGVERLVGAAE